MVAFNFPYVIFICDSCCSVNEMTSIHRQIGWQKVVVVPCKFAETKGGKGVSQAGGIVLLWNENTHVALNSYTDNHIDVFIGETSDPECWRFTGIYGYPTVQDRHRLWSLLKALSLKS